MHPALSIIVFTTLSGVGYGLAAVLGFGLLDPALIATKLAHLTALAVIAASLLASTLHLGNPQRAWRAFSQWRSSWLSREGVLAVATFVPLTASAALCWFGDAYLPLLGIAGALMAAATVYATSMIYASLKSIDAWHTGWTSAAYLMFALAGGLSLAACFGFAGNGGWWLALAAALAIALAWAVKWQWWRRLRTMTPVSTPESATGLGFIGKVSLFERPHVNENYLTREMGFRVARKHADKLTKIALLVGGVFPCLVFFALALIGAEAGVAAVVISTIAFLAYLAGLLVERWLFFAQARHAVMNYYGG